MVAHLSIGEGQEAWGWARRSLYPALPEVLDEETQQLAAERAAKRKAEADRPIEVWMYNTEIPAPEGLDPAKYLVCASVQPRDDEASMTEEDLALARQVLEGKRLV